MVRVRWYGGGRGHGEDRHMRDVQLKLSWSGNVDGKREICRVGGGRRGGGEFETQEKENIFS
jgi:hypothetical protein